MKNHFKALSFQSNGKDHYVSMQVQPVELAATVELNYFQGSIVGGLSKYAITKDARYLKKARHFAMMAAQLYGVNLRAEQTPEVMAAANRFLILNEMSEYRKIVSDTLRGNYMSVYAQLTSLWKNEFTEREIQSSNGDAGTYQTASY